MENMVKANYKFWKNNFHFNDGNLNQGLMGLGDFANIFYLVIT